MRVAMFAHSLLSDWNHGNAHFLRGVVTELSARGHEVRCYEPADGWSIRNLVRDHGSRWLVEVARSYPALRVTPYTWPGLDLDEALDGVDLVLVHEWNPESLVGALGRRRARGGRFRLLFHDTHHRAVSAPDAMARYPLEHFDGVLAFGETLREVYLARGWGRRVWTWHEAADVRVFHPRPQVPTGDLVWIGNWGDDERTVEMREYLLDPARDLGLSLRVHGVRFPEGVRRSLRRRGVRHHGWLPNFRVPEVFARHRATVHVPRRPYAGVLAGIPTIRPFEAMACGIPLVCAPWEDTEGLFRRGVDHLVARGPQQMRRHLRDVLHDRALARALSQAGRETVQRWHTCGHRVDALLDIAHSLGVRTDVPPEPVHGPVRMGVG